MFFEVNLKFGGFGEFDVRGIVIRWRRFSKGYGNRIVNEIGELRIVMI